MDVHVIPFEISRSSSTRDADKKFAVASTMLTASVLHKAAVFDV
jgi:hypothetical protein